MGTLIGGTYHPTSPGSLALWLDAADASSLSLSGSDVTQWNDKSGNGRHFAQGTSGFRPTYQTNVQHGYGVVRFDGTDDRLTLGSNDLGRNVTGATVYVVRKWATSPTTLRGFLGISTPTLTNARILVSAGATSGKTRALGRTLDADSALNTDGATSVSTSAFEIDTAVFDYANTDLHLYLNGSLDGSNLSFQTATTTSNTSSAGANVGANHVPNAFANIDIAEVLMYHAAHDATTRARVRAYLRNKWAF